MRRSDSGFTLVELVIVVAIVGILASAALPLARWSIKRSKEHELQQNLRIIRNAIDRYHDAAAAGLIEVPEGAGGFPPTLAAMVEGVPLIAPMPTPFPGVAGEYSASGPGLTGGLAAQMQAQQPAGGGFPSLAGGAAGAAGGRPSLAGTAGAARPGGPTRWLFSTSRPQPQGMGGDDDPESPAFSVQGRRLDFGQSPGGSGFGQPGTGAQPPQPLVGPDGQPVLLVLLRRIPIDPFTGDDDWGQRCYGEPPDDRLWCGGDVFDVYSKSLAKAIDGTSYRDW